MFRAFLTTVFLCSALALPLAGCASVAQQKVNAAANQPITAKVSRAAAKDAVATVFIGRNYRITKDTDLVVEFAAPTDNVWAQVLLSSNFSSQVDARVSVQFVGDNPTTVTWRAFLVTNPGSGFEQLTDVSRGADAPGLQMAISQALAAAEYNAK